MSEVFKFTTKTFAAAINVSERTVKRLVGDGMIKSILVTPKCRRLESPEAFQARRQAEEPAQ